MFARLLALALVAVGANAAPDLHSIVAKAQTQALSQVDPTGSLLRGCIYCRHAWVAKSEFDYEDPSRDILNIAYPSAIASYFVTIVPQDETYTFTGTFPHGEGVYQASLVAYDGDGDIDANITPLYERDSEGQEVTMTVANTEYEEMFVLQRFYVNPDIYSDDDIEAALFTVTNDAGKTIRALADVPRTIFSNFLEQDLKAKILANAPYLASATPIPFFLPGSTSSLFPDPARVYLAATPGASVQKMTVTGNFVASADTPYLDFLTGYQNTTETEGALPFYEFVDENGDYSITIASENYDGDADIRWGAQNDMPLIIMRVIDYTPPAVSGPLPPAYTAQVFGSLYPLASFN